MFLVDGYQLTIEPISLGGGKRVFPADGRPARAGLDQDSPDGRPHLHLPAGAPLTLPV